MKTININGKDFTIEELNSLIEQSKKENPFKEVLYYHNITEKEFEEQYKNIPNHIKAVAKEYLIVEYYNKGEKPDWSNHNQYRYYPWFDLRGKGSFFDVYCYYCLRGSRAASRSAFLRESDAKEAATKFLDIYLEVRLG